MTRCGGATGTCTCSVVAGTGISVTGNGYPETPFRVSQTSSTSGLKVTDTGTVDMTVAGSGTPSAPFDVSAAVKRSTDPGNTLTIGSDSALYVPAAGAADTGALISADDDNTLVEGTDGLLFAPAPVMWVLGEIGADLSGGANGEWEFIVDGTTFVGRPVPNYFPAEGSPCAGLYGGPGYYLLFGAPGGVY